VLKAAGLLALAGGGAAVLAGCVSTDPPTAPASSGAAPSASSAASSPSAEASSGPTETESSQAEEVPSGPSVEESSVPEGSGVIMDDADFVVTQPSKGDFKAFSKICTHQRCAVAEVSQTIDCKCHGSKFSITDGSVVNGPANEPLAEAQTKVAGGKVYVQT
jgi:Rieske Fe-S protein